MANTVNITTSISSITHQLAKDNNISWSKALEFGIQFLLADKDGVDYPECNLSIKVQRLAAKIVELSAVEEIKPVTKEEAEKEAEVILGGIEDAAK